MVREAEAEEVQDALACDLIVEVRQPIDSPRRLENQTPSRIRMLDDSRVEGVKERLSLGSELSQNLPRSLCVKTGFTRRSSVTRRGGVSPLVI